MDTSNRPIIHRLRQWRIKYISRRNYILFISAIVGIVAGIAAVFLKHAVELIQHFLTSSSYDENYYQFAYPIIGLLITVTIGHYVYKETYGHAITDILYSIARKSGRIHISKTYSRLFTSPFTVGFGGSAGLESPIVLTGAAIGSNIAQFLEFNHRTRNLMIGCGTSGVISAIFNAPVAGLIFSIEIILGEATLNHFIPLLIASVSATLTSQAFFGDEVAFRFILQEGFQAKDMIFYTLLGVVCGFFSLYFNRVLVWSEHFAERYRNIYTKALTGGIILSVLIFIAPPIFGEGYQFIKYLLAGDSESILNRSELFAHVDNAWTILVYILIVLLLKAIAAAVTIACGGSGGTFAPSLFLGAVLGFAFAKFVNLSGIATISESNFALVGMCGVLAGAQHAPLTAIFLIAELTGSYVLFLPLMAVSALSLGTVTYFVKHSIYTQDLLDHGNLLNQNLSLSHLRIDPLIETNYQFISPKSPVRELKKVIPESHYDIYPVLDQKERLMGIVTLNDVRGLLFNEQADLDQEIKQVMGQPPTFLRFGENLESALLKFERTGADHLPVMRDGKYGGFVTKTDLYVFYREKLMAQSEEEEL